MIPQWLLRIDCGQAGGMQRSMNAVFVLLLVAGTCGNEPTYAELPRHAEDESEQVQLPVPPHDLDLTQPMQRRLAFDEWVRVPLDIDEARLGHLEVIRVPPAINEADRRRPQRPVEPNGLESTHLHQRPERVTLENGHLRIRRGEWTVLRSSEPPQGTGSRPQTRELTDQKHYLNATFLYVVEDSANGYLAGNGLGHVARPARLSVRSREIPLPWIKEEAAYGSELIVELNTDDPDQVGTVVPQLRILFSTEHATIPAPYGEVSLKRIGDSASVPLRCADHRARPTVIANIAGYHGWEERYQAHIQPNLDRLEIDVSKKRLLGLGLETAVITVKRFAEDGQLLAADEGASISLAGHGDGGQFPAELTIAPASYKATEQLRSGALGSIQLQARHGDVRSNTVEVRFVWPWLLLTVAVLGSAGGTAGRLHRHREESLPLDAAMGIFTGVLLVIAAAIGMITLNVPAEIAITGAGGFVIAAVGGYIGRPVFDTIVRMLGLSHARENEPHNTDDSHNSGEPGLPPSARD